MSGFLPPDTGNVYLDGLNSTHIKPVKLTHLGLLRMFQMTRVFTSMSCIDNMLVTGLARGLSEFESKERAYSLLEELTLDGLMYMNAGSLSGGQKKLLEFGMCFIKTPKIALLDEPFAAVHPVMRKTMIDFINKRNEQGQTFVLVSHDMPIVSSLCHNSVCMSNGKVIAAGETRIVLNTNEVIEAYLGNS